MEAGGTPGGRARAGTPILDFSTYFASSTLSDCTITIAVEAEQDDDAPPTPSAKRLKGAGGGGGSGSGAAATTGASARARDVAASALFFACGTPAP